VANYFDLNDGRDYLLGRVKPWLEGIVCDISPPALVVPLILSGIYLKLVELVALQQGGEVYDIQPVTIPAANQVVLLLDNDSNGRVRDVSVWVDAASGGPLPTIRISKDASGSGGGGVRVSPGTSNELGKVPANVKLYVSSTAAISMFVISRS